MPETIQRTITLYTAAELREERPEAFDAALQSFGESEWEWGFFIEQTLEDFADNVLPVAGLSLEYPPRDKRDARDRGIEYSLGNYNGTDYARLARYAFLNVTDPRAFAAALRGKATDALDYFDKLDAVPVDLRSRLWRRLLDGTARAYATMDYDYIQPLRFRVDFDHDADEDALYTAAEDLETCVVPWIIDLFDLIATHAMDEYETNTTPDAFIEASEANDWRYTADGKLWRE